MSSIIDLSSISNDIATSDVSMAAIECEDVEVYVADSLPNIPGLSAASNASERIEIMAASIEKSRAEFIAMYGDPFGCETVNKSNSTNDASSKLLRNLQSLPRSIETA